MIIIKEMPIILYYGPNKMINIIFFCCINIFVHTDFPQKEIAPVQQTYFYIFLRRDIK